MISFCCWRWIFRNFTMVKSPLNHHLGNMLYFIYCPSILDKSKINKVERLLWFQSKQSMLCIWKSIWWDFKSVFCSFLPGRFLIQVHLISSLCHGQLMIFPPKEFHPIWDTHMFQLWIDSLWTLDSRCELRVSKRINIDTAHFATISKKHNHLIFAKSYTVGTE